MACQACSRSNHFVYNITNSINYERYKTHDMRYTITNELNSMKAARTIIYQFYCVLLFSLLIVIRIREFISLNFVNMHCYQRIRFHPNYTLHYSLITVPINTNQSLKIFLNKSLHIPFQRCSCDTRAQKAASVCSLR